MDPLFLPRMKGAVPPSTLKEPPRSGYIVLWKEDPPRPMARNPFRIALGALLLPILLALAAPVFALGSRENPLAVADQLIKEQEYNRAIDVLRQYIQANPSGLDLAQRRLNRIAAVQSDFNFTAKELLTSFVDDPANAAKHAELIQRLRDLIPKPGETEKSFIQYAERTSIKVLWDQQRLRILEEAAGQATRGLYVDAARTNARGFTLYRQQFDQDFREASTRRGSTAPSRRWRKSEGRSTVSRASRRSWPPRFPCSGRPSSPGIPPGSTRPCPPRKPPWPAWPGSARRPWTRDISLESIASAVQEQGSGPGKRLLRALRGQFHPGQAPGGAGRGRFRRHGRPVGRPLDSAGQARGRGDGAADRGFRGRASPKGASRIPTRASGLCPPWRIGRSGSTDCGASSCPRT
ncbi:MAG: hypothetical protein MZV70_22385 [Desulfobacterales bacterium]|nr:hypothetical protein [Desulfobacterales bacterium]